MQNVGSDNARRDFAYLRAVPAYRSPAPRSSRRGIQQREFHRSTLSTRMGNAVSTHRPRKKQPDSFYFE